MKTALVVFDIAGTTVVDKGNINDAFREAFLAFGIDVPAADVNTVMGYRKIEAIEIMVKKHQPAALAKDPSILEHIHTHFTKNMVNFYSSADDLTPLPFAEEVFTQLQSTGIRVALDTGFTRIITDAILDKLGWKNSPLINMVICSDEVPEGRPHPYMINEIMKKFSITDASLVVKVGDTGVDVQEGKNAGCGLVVAITTGAYTPEQLAIFQPDKIIDSLQQLPALIS